MTGARFQGIIAAVVTPFTEEGAVDFEKLRPLCRFLKAHVQGIFVSGTYGSVALLHADERRRIAETVMEEVRGALGVLVHVGSADTATTLDLARHAESAGADAVAAVLPYYYEHSYQAILTHFQSLVEAVNVPVYVYNYPKSSHTRLTCDLLAQLTELGVVGMKDSAHDLLQLSSFMREVRGKGFEFIIGTETLLVPAMHMGCRAGMSGLAVAFPEIVVQLYAAVSRGDIELAGHLQSQIMTLRSVLHQWPHIPATYAALRLRGVDAGVPRKPFLALDREARAEMRGAIEQAGLNEEVMTWLSGS